MPVTPDFKERLNAVTKRNKNWKNARKQYLPGSPYPEEAWLEVVGQYLVLGNMRLVAAMTGISYDLIRKWKNTPKWLEIENELRATQNIEMDNKLSKIVEKSLDATLDRVENGDFIYDQKSGQIRRKPASLRDVHRVAVDSLDRRETLRGNVRDRKESTQVSVQEQLKMLAQEFAKWVDKDKHEVIELTEVEDAVYAVSKEWEEGLQEGAGVGEEEETHEAGRPSSEECSPEGCDGTGPSPKG